MLIGFFTGSATVMGSFFTEAWFPIGDWRWAIGAIVALIIAAAIYAYGHLKNAREQEASDASGLASNSLTNELQIIHAIHRQENIRKLWHLLGYLPYLIGPLLMFAYLFAQL